MRNILLAAAAAILVTAPAVAQVSNMSVNLTTTGFAAASTINAGIVGAGVNGPGHAQVGLKVNMNKANWWLAPTAPGAPAVGEEDGVYASLFQGGAGSDTSAYLGEVTATGLGFADILEGTITIQSPITTGNGVLDAVLDVQMGMINVGNQIYGANANLTLKPTGATAVGYNLNGAGWDYLAQWWNGSTDEFHVDGAGNVHANGAVQVGLFTTAALPANCTIGQQLYATDGRKTGEAAGQGSGVLVTCSQVSRNGTTAWMTSTLAGTIVQR